MGQGGPQIESTTGTSGGVRVTARLLVTGVIAAGAFCAPQSALADPAVEGAWGPLQQYPVVPVSMGVMPDGKIVAWDQANRPPNFGSVPNNGPAMILDPQTGQITRTANIAPRTTFCSLIATLPDGKLLEGLRHALLVGGQGARVDRRPGQPELPGHRAHRHRVVAGDHLDRNLL